MTRINCVDPSYLSNKHLGAAWNETPRIITNVEDLINKGRKVQDVAIPNNYQLGLGHQRFFYNKLSYIRDYLIAIYVEGRSRELNYSCLLLAQYLKRIDYIGSVNADWCNNWEPSLEDIYLNMARLVGNHYGIKSYKVIGRKIVNSQGDE